MFKFHAKLDADSLLYSFSHFERDGHTVQHAHSTVSAAPTDQYSELVIVPTCTSQSTRLGCQVTSMVTKTVLVILTMADFFQTDLIYVLQGVKDFHLFSPLTRKLHIPEIVFTFGKPISHCTYNSLDCLKYISHGSAEEVWWQQSISISLLTQASPNSTCSEFKKKKQEEVLLSPAGPLFISIPFYLGFLRPTLHCSHT